MAYSSQRLYRTSKKHSPRGAAHFNKGGLSKKQLRAERNAKKTSEAAV